jgi:hypothetical protein
MRVVQTAAVASAMLISFQLSAESQRKEGRLEQPTLYHTVQVDGVERRAPGEEVAVSDPRGRVAGSSLDFCGTLSS